MKIVKSNTLDQVELPLELNISFEKVFSIYHKYADKKFKEHPYHNSAKKMAAAVEEAPELIDGFSDFDLLEKHQKKINLLLDPIFPEALLLNEIKSATVPFSFTSFKFTSRFENILNNSDSNFELKPRNFEDNLLYIYSCTMILAKVHGYVIDLKRPFYFDIPDKTSGIIKHYRAAFNGDFDVIIPTKNAPKITEKDYRELLDNFDNIDIWKEKFPPNSYIYKGFGIMNLFDVTTDETITNIRTNLLRGHDNLIDDLEENIREFYNINDLRLGYSVFDISNIEAKSITTKNSLIFRRMK